MTAVRGWQLLVDWSGGGGFTGPLEDVTNYVNRQDITVSWGRSIDSLSLTAPSSPLEFELVNRTRTWDRYFSPENASSPIYGKVLPGRAVKFTRTVRGSGSLYSEAAFLTSLGGWSAVGGGTLTRVASPSEDGNGALSYVPPGAVATVGVTRLAFIDLTLQPASQYLAYFRVQATAAFSNAVAAIDWYDSTGTLVGTGISPTFSLAAGTWTTVQSNYLAPPTTAVQARLRLQLGSTPPNTTTFYIDSATLVGTPNDADKTYVLHSGVLDDFSVDSQSAARTFSGSSLDAWGRPSSKKLSTIVFTALRTGDAIRNVLTEIGWTGDTAIDPGVTVMPFWWEEGTDPGEAIDKIVRSEGPPAIAYVEGGTFVFRDRHHRIRSAASNTSQGLFSLIVPAGAGPGYDFKVEKDSFTYDHGIKSIVNSVTFSVDQRRPLDPQEVWTSDDPIALNTGETATIFAQPSDPVINAITPTMAAGDIQAASGAFTATIDRASGQRFTIVITCTGSGTISRLALRGNPISVTRTVQATSSDSGSAGRYGSAAWPDDVPWCNVYDAQAIADRIVTIYADNRPRIGFTLVNFNDRYTSKMCGLRISDRITVRNDVLGFSRDFHIEQLEHSVSRLQVHRVRVSAIAAEPVQPANVFTFNVSGKGFNDGAFGAFGIDNANTMFIFNQAGQGFDQGLIAT